MTKLAEMKAALEAATPGPWYQNPFTPINVQDRHGLTVCSMAGARASGGDDFQAELEANAQLIAKAPTLLAELVEQIERLQKVADAAEDLPDLYDAAMADPYDVGYSQVSDQIEALRQTLKELDK